MTDAREQAMRTVGVAGGRELSESESGWSVKAVESEGDVLNM